MSTSPVTRLITPHPALAGCVRAYITRDTHGAELTAAQRLNRFPASPFSAITWFLEGETWMVEPAATEPLPPVVVHGLFSRPTVSMNPGPVRAFMIVLYPEALTLLAGVDLVALTDRLATPAEVFGADWCAFCAAVAAAPDDQARIALTESFLAPRWLRAAPPVTAAAGWLDRLHALATGDRPLSERHTERRIKALAGQSLRRLRRLVRSERTLIETRSAIENDRIDWADLALQAGYADQAHMCRETRELTGASPSVLARLGMRDESYWLYRIWA